jgi:rhodanese-related sulfurtransferase
MCGMIEPRTLLSEYPPDRPDDAAAHFAARLRYECDSADLYADLMNEVPGVFVVDCRSRDFYVAAHIPGAIHLPHRLIDEETTAQFPKDALIVTYCDGIGCNGSTKGALKFARLGFEVKELLGGIDWWIRDGLPIASGLERGSLTQVAIACGC